VPGLSAIIAAKQEGSETSSATRLTDEDSVADRDQIHGKPDRSQ